PRPEAPYARSPELRITHKLAERRRRQEMKELFDDLREALPVEPHLKTSKWEILTK
ncbi:bHLH transcription factor-like protein, partial [Syncephalis plumigaleata]